MQVKAEGPSSAAVQAKTGKTWEEWYAILDAAGAASMSHKAIAEYLYEKQGVPGWWAQTVTVGYERARGIREKYQKADGFSASRSKTFDAPLDKLYEAWADAKIRKRWLRGAETTVRRSTANKTMRISWGDGRTSVTAYFLAKGSGKSQVAIEHSKLADTKDVERMKDYWGKNLDRLKELLES
ncbi:MAG: SRPBCC domain-containing protein [Bryobacteraceae bacterium]